MNTGSLMEQMSAVKSFLKYAAGKDKTLMALYLDTDAIPKKKDTKVHKIEMECRFRW